MIAAITKAPTPLKRAVHVLSPTYVVTLTNDIYREIRPKLSTGTDGANCDIRNSKA